MNGPDRMPATQPNKQFPIGDVDDKQKDERAKAWFRKVESFKPDDFVTYVELTSKAQAMDGVVTNVNHEKALELCIDWDDQQGGNRHFAVTGFFVAKSFMNETRVLPKFSNDLQSEIENMRSPDMVGRAREFGRAAWSGLHYSHPRVAAYYDRLYEHALGVYDFEDKEEYREYMRAGMALPYMMSATSRLIGYTGEFTGMTTQKHNLQTTPFSRLFTNVVELAHEDPKQRLL